MDIALILPFNNYFKGQIFETKKKNIGIKCLFLSVQLFYLHDCVMWDLSERCEFMFNSKISKRSYSRNTLLFENRTTCSSYKFIFSRFQYKS